MISDFGAKFDSYYAAIQSQNAYLSSKGYRAEGARVVWEPTDPTDLEPTTVGYGPGAMAAGEVLDDVYQHNDEPSLVYEEVEEF